MDENTFAHTSWNCKYHIVFAAKYRRQIIYSQIKQDIGQISRNLCERKGVNIIVAEACPDHIHIFVEIPQKFSLSEIMRYLKGKSSLMIFDRHANLKYKYGNRNPGAADITLIQLGKMRNELRSTCAINCRKTFYRINSHSKSSRTRLRVDISFMSNRFDFGR